LAEFFASCPKGLADLLEIELQDLGLKTTHKNMSGVGFESSWEGCYKANLHSRLASRILKPVLEFTAYQPEELYSQILRHDFTKYIKPNQTISIDAKVKDSMMRDQRFVTLKIKDAIVDQFRLNCGGIRPDVDSDNPDLQIYVRARQNQFVVALDTSGISLFKRGYRSYQTEAPLKENLAYGLVALSGWDGMQPMLDPMCGSGTLLIEAALKKANVAPGILRKKFGFQTWTNFDGEVWDRLVTEAMDAEIEQDSISFYGFDLDRKALVVAKESARRAGVDHMILWTREPVASIQPEVAKGFMLTNPPYGARLGEEDTLKDLYRDLGFFMKKQLKGWDCWVLSGNRNLTEFIKLKNSQRIQIFNGAIECRYLKYLIN
jgi:23S rRNA G2445 N2-methylase RlmL